MYRIKTKRCEEQKELLYDILSGHNPEENCEFNQPNGNEEVMVANSSGRNSNEDFEYQ